MEGITYQYIVDYINQVQPEWEPEIVELERYAKENYVPIIQKEVSRFLYVLGLLKSPKTILEVGTAIGYSAIIFSKVISEDGLITSIERDDNMYEIASSNIKKFNLSDKIKVIKGDALEVLPKLYGEYDLIFIDASKGHYEEFFKEAERMIKKGGIIVSDNVLYKGMIANDDLVKRRNRTITNRMRSYLNRICNDEKYITSVLPIGDGVAISLKK
jgi:predicted O-methyltransferase YrrM